MSTRIRGASAIVVMAAGFLIVSAFIAATVVAARADDGEGASADATTVELGPIIASWPTAYSVTGAKSEPLYSEHIAFTRDGDRFALRIEAIGQGDTRMGTQHSVVSVADGRVRWESGCVKEADACADDPALRGFLATAALVALADAGAEPATGVQRELHDTAVVCVDDSAIHPDAAPAVVRLDPCFDWATGAVLGQWSADSGAFVGATLQPGFTITPDATPDLFTP